MRKLEYFRQGGSTKHLTDIRAMLRIRPDLIDRQIVETFAAERGLRQEWSRITAPGDENA